MYIFASMSSTTSTCTQKGSALNHIQNHSVFPESVHLKQKRLTQTKRKILKKFTNAVELEFYKITKLTFVMIL